MQTVDDTLKIIARWMREHRLEIAVEKTEAILLSRKRKVDHIRFNFKDIIINPVKQVNYLGFHIDRALTMGLHIKEVCLKSQRTAKALSAILPNVRGPTPAKRRVLAYACQNIIMYGAPVWNEATNMHVNKKRLEGAQRVMALRVCSAYRTTSTEAALVISGLVPLHLLSRERERLFLKGEVQTRASREMERNRTVQQWQAEWEVSQKGRWTYKLIPNINMWIKRKHGEVNFYLTQILSGHGNFGSYLCKIGKREVAECRYCAEPNDTPEHTMFACPRWEQERCEARMTIGGNISADTFLKSVTERRENFEAISKLAQNILEAKYSEEQG